MTRNEATQKDEGNSSLVLHLVRSKGSEAISAWLVRVPRYQIAA